MERLVGEVRLTQRFQGVARILEVKFQALYAVFIFRLDNLELFETFEEFVETCVLVLNLAHFLSKFLIFSLNSGNACLHHRLLCRQSLHDQACLFKATVAPRQLDGCAFALLAEAAFGIFGAPLGVFHPACGPLRMQQNFKYRNHRCGTFRLPVSTLCRWFCDR